MPPKNKMTKTDKTPIKEKNSREKEKRPRIGKKAKRYSLPSFSLVSPLSLDSNFALDLYLVWLTEVM